MHVLWWDRESNEREVNTNNHSKSTGAHFNLKGHIVSDMEITIIEKIFSQDHRFKKAKREILQTKIKL